MEASIFVSTKKNSCHFLGLVSASPGHDHIIYPKKLRNLTLIPPAISSDTVY